MRIAKWVILFMAAAALTACGSKKPQSSAEGSDPSERKPQFAPSGNASAEEVAEEARGDVDCPAEIETPARAANAPVDDVVGLRPGLTYEEAANVALCSNDLMVVEAVTSRGVNMQTYGQTIRQGFGARTAEARVEKTSKEIRAESLDEMLARQGNAARPDMKAGEAKIYVATMGMPGQERVISAAREEWFAEGKNPTLASVEQALIAKYGNPTKKSPAPGQKYLIWAYDPLGRPITETSPLYSQCSGNASPDGGANYSPDCGLVVAAIIVPLHDNPELSQYFQVGVVNAAGGYEAITATEQNLQQLDTQRKAQQVQEASKNADAPTL